MNATINAVCYTSKTLKNGENPIMLRVTSNGKRKYLSLGISINQKHWNFKKNLPKSNCPNLDYIKTIILNKTTEIQKQLLDFKTSDREFTAKMLIESSKQSTKSQTVGEFYTDLISSFKKTKKLGNARIYRDSINSIKTFTNSDDVDLLFSEIDIDWLNKYEKWLDERGIVDTTKSLLFRTLRSSYNKAIAEKIARKENYPFSEFRISKFNTKTAKRSIAKSDIEKLINYSTDNEYKQLALDIFIFSYFTAGINFVDIAHLTTDNILDNCIVYIRKKTKKQIKIPLQNKALQLIEKYHISGKYLFPILSDFHKSEEQKADRVHKVLGKTNKYLNEIGEELNLPIKLTTYVSRHTFATVLKRSGVNTSIISESLGHSSEKVTQIYLDSFENSQIDEAMKNLLQ